MNCWSENTKTLFNFILLLLVMIQNNFVKAREILFKRKRNKCHYPLILYILNLYFIKEKYSLYKVTNNSYSLRIQSCDYIRFVI